MGIAWGVGLRTRDTVLCDTLANLATSRMVTRRSDDERLDCFIETKLGNNVGNQGCCELGSVDISTKPDQGRGDLPKSHIAACQLVIASENASEPFEFVDKTLD